MTGLWLSQDELDRLAQLVGNLRYTEALPIIQLLNSAHERSAARRAPPTQRTADVPIPAPAAEVANGASH